VHGAREGAFLQPANDDIWPNRMAVRQMSRTAQSFSSRIKPYKITGLAAPSVYRKGSKVYVEGVKGEPDSAKLLAF
jgi:hypothetical protein